MLHAGVQLSNIDTIEKHAWTVDRLTNKAKETCLSVVYLSGNSRYIGRPSKNYLETQNRAKHHYGIQTVSAVIMNSEINSCSNST